MEVVEVYLEVMRCRWSDKVDGGGEGVDGVGKGSSGNGERGEKT